jgi:hypothetical protein
VRRGNRACGAIHKQRRTGAAQTDHAGFVAIDNRFECLAAPFALKEEPPDLERTRQMWREPFQAGDVFIVVAALFRVLKNAKRREPAVARKQRTSKGLRRQGEEGTH